MIMAADTQITNVRVVLKAPKQKKYFKEIKGQQAVWKARNQLNICCSAFENV